MRTITLDAEQPIAEGLDDLAEWPERLRVSSSRGEGRSRAPTDTELEKALHAINQFIRSKEGRRSLVVWPTNSDEVVRRIQVKASQVGGDALIGVHPDGMRFEGPPKDEYLIIARGTVQALNEGASLIALGVTDERAAELAREAPTIGAFLAPFAKRSGGLGPCSSTSSPSGRGTTSGSSWSRATTEDIVGNSPAARTSAPISTGCSLPPTPTSSTICGATPRSSASSGGRSTPGSSTCRA